MKTRLTIEYIRQKFSSEGYTLLSTTYKNAHSKLFYRCSHGHVNFVTWGNFKQKSSCPDCAGLKRKTIDQICDLFKKEGYTLLSTEYVNYKSRLSYLCPEKHSGETDWDHFQQGHRCPNCAGVKSPTIEYVKSVFEREGYVLLSTRYENCDSKLEYICSEGHREQIGWSSFRCGNRCPSCAGNKGWTFKQVQEFFISQSYVLLSQKYRNIHSRLKFLCPNKHKGSIVWANFYHAGQRCKECHEYRGETRLYEILKIIYPNKKIRRWDNLGFLGRQQVDFSIRSLKIAFEYDGAQHSRPVTYGKLTEEQAQENFKIQQERDGRKNVLCLEKGYSLVRIAHNENLTLNNIIAKIEKVNK